MQRTGMVVSPRCRPLARHAPGHMSARRGSSAAWPATWRHGWTAFLSLATSHWLLAGNRDVSIIGRVAMSRSEPLGLDEISHEQQTLDLRTDPAALDGGQATGQGDKVAGLGRLDTLNAEEADRRARAQMPQSSGSSRDIRTPLRQWRPSLRPSRSRVGATCTRIHVSRRCRHGGRPHGRSNRARVAWPCPGGGGRRGASTARRRGSRAGRRGRRSHGRR